MPKKRSRTLASVADPSPPEADRDQPGSTEAATPAAALAADPAVAAGRSGSLPPGEEAVVRRTADGWRGGDDELPDLTCAMVLADLLAAELPTEIQPAIPSVAETANKAESAARSPARRAPVKSA